MVMENVPTCSTDGDPDDAVVQHRFAVGRGADVLHADGDGGRFAGGVGRGRSPERRPPEAGDGSGFDEDAPLRRSLHPHGHRSARPLPGPAAPCGPPAGRRSCRRGRPPRRGVSPSRSDHRRPAAPTSRTGPVARRTTGRRSGRPPSRPCLPPPGRRRPRGPRRRGAAPLAAGRRHRRSLRPDPGRRAADRHHAGPGRRPRVDHQHLARPRPGVGGEIGQRLIGQGVADLAGFGVADQHLIGHRVGAAGTGRVVGAVGDQPLPGDVEQRRGRRPLLGWPEQGQQRLGPALHRSLGGGGRHPDIDPVRDHSGQHRRRGRPNAALPARAAGRRQAPPPVRHPAIGRGRRPRSGSGSGRRSPRPRRRSPTARPGAGRRRSSAAARPPAGRRPPLPSSGPGRRAPARPPAGPDRWRTTRRGTRCARWTRPAPPTGRPWSPPRSRPARPATPRRGRCRTGGAAGAAGPRGRRCPVRSPPPGPVAPSSARRRSPASRFRTIVSGETTNSSIGTAHGPTPSRPAATAARTRSCACGRTSR